MEIFKKRNWWCVKDDTGKTRKFTTKKPAEDFAGLTEEPAQAEFEFEEADDIQEEGLLDSRVREEKIQKMFYPRS